MSQSPFLRMPLHLIALVLSELDTIKSLGCAILSHTFMLSAFKEPGQEAAIMRRVLINQIPPDMMPYAEATCEATLRRQGILWSSHRRRTQNPYWHEDMEIRYILSGLVSMASHPAPDLDFQQRSLRVKFEVTYRHARAKFASCLSNTHTVVEYFTRRFLGDIFPLSGDLYGKGLSNAQRPSDDEVFRVRRAFYRFQLFCELIPREVGDLNPEQLPMDVRVKSEKRFFRGYSPWVNEQLACIHDYLERLLSKGA